MEKHSSSIPFCSVALHCLVRDAWSAALARLMIPNMTPSPGAPSAPCTPTCPGKHVHAIWQDAWHVPSKAALKAFWLGVRLMKSAFKSIVSAGRYKPSLRGFLTRQEQTQREQRKKEKTLFSFFFYGKRSTRPLTFNACQEPFPFLQHGRLLLCCILLWNVSCGGGSIG